jgi:hypothetical protein
VALGVALTVVGAGVSLTAFLQTPQSSDTQLAPFSVTSLPAGAATTDLLWMQNTSSGSIEIDWVSTLPLNVTFYLGAHCEMSSHVCPSGVPIKTWTSTSAGRWSVNGALNFPYLLNFLNPGPARANVTGSAAETFAAGSTSPPTWAFVASLAGGVSCISIGAVALYLGLFLREGVYDAPLTDAYGADEFDEYSEGGDLEEPPDDLGDDGPH